MYVAALVVILRFSVLVELVTIVFLLEQKEWFLYERLNQQPLCQRYNKRPNVIFRFTVPPNKPPNDYVFYKHFTAKATLFQQLNASIVNQWEVFVVL